VSKRDPIDRALASFPKLYHYIPPLPKTLNVGGKKVNVKSPREAILWLLETLTKDTRKPHCLHGDLQDLIQRWHPGMTPARFSGITSELKRFGFITKSQHSGQDDRTKQLALTKRGQSLLAAIKAYRRDTIVNSLFTGLNARQRDKLADSIEAVAAWTWPKIKEVIKPHSQPRARR
jgi:DNA-binding MarR family transcriptional regulator